MLSEDLQNFIDNYHHVLLVDHLYFLINVIDLAKTMEQEEKIISIYGEHYTSCPWSRDTTTHGVDTCVCFTYEKKCVEAIKLMDLYSRLKY